jgi:hypothetical protein
MSQAIDYHRIISSPSRGNRNRMLIYPQAQHSLIDSVAVEHSVLSYHPPLLSLFLFMLEQVWTNTLLWLSLKFDPAEITTLF